jgi:hypothetical protein
MAAAQPQQVPCKPNQRSQSKRHHAIELAQDHNESGSNTGTICISPRSASKDTVTFMTKKL